MVWLIILHFGVCESITTLLVLNATTIHLYLQDKPQKKTYVQFILMKTRAQTFHSNNVQYLTILGL